ncbi:MAG: hypothetical protein ABWZ66_01165 [Pyrinomonadaceae bacterium]
MEQFTRPDMDVLPDEALIPDGSLISPPPNQFTHELKNSQPFYYTGAQQASPPDGEFPEKTKVVLFRHDGGSHCRVVDGQGLYVEIEFQSLKKL